jgi:glycerophosphoryl diester phosphodiesterase
MELLRGDRDVVRVGHRGAATLAPENTLAAIEAAANAGVDAVEVDVLCRADGALVIAHGPGLPLDAPPLDDALALVARLGLAVQLDVKLPALAEGCVAALRAHGLLGRSFVSSFSPPILHAFAELEPSVPRALTYPEDRHGVTGNRFLRPAVRPGLAAMRAVLPLRLPRFLRAVDARAATLHWAVVTPAVVAACHASGAAVYVWTVNERALARTLVESGIDGIITDDPRILARGIWRDLKHDLKTT